MAHHSHNDRHGHGHGGHRNLETVIDMARAEKPGRFGFTGGLEFTSLTYKVVKKQRGAGGEWEKKDVDLLHDITGCVTAVKGPAAPASPRPWTCSRGASPASTAASRSTASR
jgi:hypothetical protein